MKTSTLFCILTAVEAAGFPLHSPILHRDGGHKETHVSVLPPYCKTADSSNKAVTFPTTKGKSFKSLGVTVETLLSLKTNAWFRCQYYETPDILFSLLYANEPSAFPHLRWFESSRLLSHRISGEPQLSPAITRLPPRWVFLTGAFPVLWASFCASWCQPSLPSPSGPLLHLATQSPIPPFLASQTIFTPLGPSFP